ncbi:type II toxin-antitoxin system HicA family toxin [Pseudomonas sp. NY15366]
MSRQVINTGRRCCKRLWPLFGYAQAHGWQITRTNGGHLRLTKPGRPIVHTSSTPSDWRAVRNAVSMLARADGYRVLEVDRA